MITEKEYKEKLNKWNEGSIFNLKTNEKSFKWNMTKKHKIVFEYLIKKLEEEKIIYRYLDNFYIILKDIHYFYFELYDDLSGDYINFKNEQIDLKFNYKKDVDKFLIEMKGGLKNDGSSK